MGDVVNSNRFEILAWLKLFFVYMTKVNTGNPNLNSFLEFILREKVSSLSIHLFFLCDCIKTAC